MKSLIYKFANTRLGLVIRKRLDDAAARNPTTKKVGNVILQYKSVTDWDVNMVSVTNGMGYDADWVMDGDWVSDGPAAAVLDLGCNTGLFPLWIKNHKPSIQLSGIGVDANPLMVARAEQHWRLNGLAMVAMQGLVGEPARRFSINSNHVASSCVSRESTPGMEVASLNVWALDIEKIWDSEVKWLGDLMKVDIEGSELGLFSKTKIASRFKRIVVEWHEPLCSLPMLRYLLTDHKLDKFSTHGDIGYAYFSRI